MCPFYVVKKIDKLIKNFYTKKKKKNLCQWQNVICILMIGVRNLEEFLQTTTEINVYFINKKNDDHMLFYI